MNATLWLMVTLSTLQLQGLEPQAMASNACDTCQQGGYDEFSSPCGKCRGGRGRCRTCCKDSTCNMHPHYAYQPEHHGYYYFRPYNYTNVLAHQSVVAQWGGDPRSPYSRAMFIPVYEQFENTTYEPNSKPSQSLSTLPNLSKTLPNLDELVKKNAGTAPAPAPQN